MTGFFYKYGLFGLFLAGFLSGSVFPFNSEAVLSILILSGFNAISCLIVATLGNLLGGISIYWLGYLGNMKWIEKYGRVKEEKIQAILPRLNRYGPIIATLSFVPVIGDVIILALGFFRISPLFTTLFMFIGKAGRYIFIIWIMKMAVFHWS
jgi:membrane protein YqaA with SNARE-associated domain